MFDKLFQLWGQGATSGALYTSDNKLCFLYSPLKFKGYEINYLFYM